jgi:hypothetical protein
MWEIRKELVLIDELQPAYLKQRNPCAPSSLKIPFTTFAIHLPRIILDCLDGKH